MLWTLWRLYFCSDLLPLQTARTTIKCQMSSKFGYIRQRLVKLAALELLEKSPQTLKWGKCCPHSSVFNFDFIISTLVGKDGNHYSLDELEFRPDSTTIKSRTSSNFGQIGLRTVQKASGKIPIDLKAEKCCDHLQITRTYMKAWMSSNFGQISPLASELSAPEHLTNIFIML